MGSCFAICVLELWQVASRPTRLIYLTADTSAELLIDAKQVTLQKGESPAPGPLWKLGKK